MNVFQVTFYNKTIGTETQIRVPKSLPPYAFSAEKKQTARLVKDNALAKVLSKPSDRDALK